MRVMDNNYGALFIPLLGLVSIRSKLVFATICILALMSEIGFIASPIAAKLNELTYTTMIISQVRRRPAPATAPEVTVQTRGNETRLVLEFPDCAFEFKHYATAADGKSLFSVKTTSTGGNHAPKHDPRTKGSTRRHPDGGEG